MNFRSTKILKTIITSRRSYQNVTNNGEVQTWRSVPYPLADELRKNYGSDFKHIVMGVTWDDTHNL